MPDAVIRYADEDDLNALCRLYYEFHDFHVRGVPDRLQSPGPDETQDNTRLTNDIKRILDDENSTILVAELRGEVIGLVEVYLRKDDPQNRFIVPHRYGFVQSLMVKEQERQRGTGRDLMRAAHEWAASKGADEMRLDIWEFTAGPLSFYEKMGYRTIKRTMITGL